MFSSSYINHLIIFVPIGIATYYLESHHLIVFATNAIAIVPLSNILAHATECIAIDLGDAVGALMNISFGNLVEIIMFFAALRRKHPLITPVALLYLPCMDCIRFRHYRRRAYADTRYVRRWPHTCGKERTCWLDSG